MGFLAIIPKEIFNNHAMDETINDILKRNNLSVTESRKKILGLFIDHQGALHHGVIEKELRDEIDRVTIYRTLQTFVDKGIIHTIPTNENTIRYALCKEHCAAGFHHDNHVHFICKVCGIATCLENVLIPVVKLPKGFKPLQAEMVVSGICKDCT